MRKQIEAITNIVRDNSSDVAVVDDCYVYRFFQCPRDRTRLRYNWETQGVHCPKCNYVLSPRTKQMPILEEKRVPVALNIFERSFD